MIDVCETYMAKWIRCVERKYEVPAHYVFPYVDGHYR